MSDDWVIPEKDGHGYPSRYGRGVNWAVDEAWDILDTLPVDLLSNTQRAFIAGRIAGALWKATKDAQSNDRKSK
jgi:hypothetical protein